MDPLASHTIDLTAAMTAAGVSADDQRGILVQVGETVLIDIVAALIEKLPEGYQADFEAVQAAGDAERMYFFLHEAIPDADMIAEEAARASVARFRELAGLEPIN